MELREFTPHDWYGFSDVEQWPDSVPLLAKGRFENGMDWVLVLDKNGGCFIADDAQGPYGGYMLERKFASAAEARLFAKVLGEPTHRFDFFVAGFKAI